MTYNTVSGGALNSTQSNVQPPPSRVLSADDSVF